MIIVFAINNRLRTGRVSWVRPTHTHTNYGHACARARERVRVRRNCIRARLIVVWMGVLRTLIGIKDTLHGASARAQVVACRIESMSIGMRVIFYVIAGSSVGFSSACSMQCVPRIRNSIGDTHTHISRDTSTSSIKRTNQIHANRNRSKNIIKSSTAG